MNKLLIHTCYLLLGIVILLLYFAPALWGEGAILASTYPDAWSFVWNIWRFSTLWTDIGEGVYYTKKIFHPYGTSLALHTQAELLSFPISLFLGSISPILAFNLGCLLCFVMNFLSMFWFVYRFSNSPHSPFVIALLFTFHPFFSRPFGRWPLKLSCVFPCSARVWDVSPTAREASDWRPYAYFYLIAQFAGVS